MEFDEQKKLTKWRQTHEYREETESCQGEKAADWVRRVKGFREEEKRLTDKTPIW